MFSKIIFGTGDKYGRIFFINNYFKTIEKDDKNGK